MKKELNYSRAIFLLLLCICVILVGAVLKITAEVVLPVIVAIMLAFVFQPVLVFLKKKFHIPNVLGILVIFVILLAAIFVIGNLLFSSVKTIISVYPKYEERFLYVYKAFAEIFHLSYDDESGLFTNLWNQLGIRNAIQSLGLSLSNGLIDFAKNLTVVALFVIFFLSETALFKAKAIAAMDGKSPGKIMSMVKDIVLQVTRYLSVKFFISLLTGVLVFLGTMVVGLDFPIIWGFLAFVLNFIPNFGSILSGVLTTLFALLQFWPSFGQVVWVAFVMLSVNMVLGNFIEPKVQGRSLGLSPFVIIVSLSVWGWIWGFMGMILAVPMMVILKIICENVEFLRPISIVMGSKVPSKLEPNNNEHESASTEPSSGVEADSSGNI
ncbi:MAG: AI-2E family transporter [Spirochaetaceae bacterium]|nr:AI-2E family transporter [Spirochaetaceae bacterium]